MLKKRKIAVTQAMITVLCCTGLAYADADGGRNDAFYTFGAGARSMGMGKAYSAVADTAEAMYWNPAGLMQVQKMEVSTLSSDLFFGYKYNYSGIVWPMPDQVIAFHTASLSSPTFEGRDASNVFTHDFTDAKSSMGGSFATKLSPQLSLGFNYKNFARVLDTYSDTVTLIDGGVLYKANESLRVGLSALNLVAMLDTSKTSDKFPLNLRAGAAYQVTDVLLLAFDLGDGLSHWYMGGEFQLHPMLVLRGGINYDEFTWGVGLSVDPLFVDYSQGSMDLGNSSRFSVRFKIGGSTLEQKVEMAKKLNDTGVEAYQNGFYLSAFDHLAKALELNPDNVKVKVRMDRVKQVVAIMPIDNLENEMKAFEAFQKSEKAYKDGNYGEAQQQVERALKIYPANPSLYILQQKIAEKMGK